MNDNDLYMNDKLWMASCDPSCSFMVKSHDRNEVEIMIKEHAKMRHDTDMSDDEVAKMVVVA